MKKLVFFFLFFIVILGAFLRFYKIPTNPPGLYIDEVSIGLNAYDVLTRGQDQYGNSHPLFFPTFGEYKLPVYIYSVSGAMAIFGKNEFAIRFPSALAGTLMLIVIFFLSRELFLWDKKTSEKAWLYALLATLLLAITPWHIHFSRAGFEANEALFFYSLGLLCGLYFVKKNKLIMLILSCISFLLAFYTYDAYRLIVPITLFCGFVWCLRKKEYRKNAAIGVVLAVILALPMLQFSFFQHGLARLSQTSAFAENPFSQGYKKYLTDIVIYKKNYLSYFSITYLFRFGDQINRHQVNNLGILYIWQLPFLISGVYFLRKTSNKLLKWLLLFLFLLGPIPASLARPSPHTLRNLFSVLPFTLLTIVGIYQMVLQKKKWVKIVLVGILIFAILEVGYYFHYYYVHYPKDAVVDWGGACKEVVVQMKKEQPNYKHIVVDNNLTCVNEYFAFYAPNIPITRIGPDWRKPSSWGKTLLIRPFYGEVNPPHDERNILLKNVNKDIFAQFISL